MRKGFLVAGTVCLILCVVCIVCFVLALPHKDAVVPGGPDVTEHDTSYVSQSADIQTLIKPESDTEAELYKSPVDFESLQGINPDVYAWIEIEGTDISYPVAQSPVDDKYYLKHTVEGKYSDNGTLFTEHQYNGTNFDDPVTVIYGHNMGPGTGIMFGDLEQMYSDDGGIQKYRDITVYTPERELHYSVFAAVPYSNRHILYYYSCFSGDGLVDEFIDSIYEARGFGVNTDKNFELHGTDRILVLSTCLQSNDSKRYLVLARLEEINM